MTDKLDTYIEIIKGLFSKYQDDGPVMEKIYTSIGTLPNIIDNFKTSIVEKEEKIAQLKKDKHEFKEEFLKTNPYFYVSTMSRFFYYDGIHYTIINEDDIHYTLFTSLSENKNLQNSKYKTQAETIREIKKTRSILDTIPEKETIQFVINNLTPVLFSSVADIKYFMIVIGNQILKQHQTYIHFIHPQSKNAMTFIEKYVFETVGVNITDNFKIRYHNHDFKKCRLVRMNTSVENNSSFLDFFKHYTSDFVSVCCYYSRRYKTEDVYVSRISNKVSKNYILYLKNSSISKIVAKFKDTHLISSCVDSVISCKYMNFMWKWYIHDENIPNVLSMNSLRDTLSNLLPHDEKKDVFTHVTCSFMKIINEFVEFCSNNLVESVDDLDISEIIDIYHDENPTNEQIEESIFVMMLKNGILPYKMKNSNSISNISCKLWNKRDEVFNSITEYRASMSDKSSIKCYDAYKYYVSNDYKYVANKMYFERYFYSIS